MSNTQEQDLENRNDNDSETGSQFHEELEAAMNDAQDADDSNEAIQEKVGSDLDDYKDKYVRLFAEFENFRRRTTRESFELMGNANHKLLGKMTEVLDNFNLAFDPKNKSASPEDFEKGIRLIFSKFKNLLSDEGLTEVDPIGQEFDPNLHEALMQQPSETVPENHIIQVFQKGYKAKNKILKHAKVVVSTGKP